MQLPSSSVDDTASLSSLSNAERCSDPDQKQSDFSAETPDASMDQAPAGHLRPSVVVDDVRVSNQPERGSLIKPLTMA